MGVRGGEVIDSTERKKFESGFRGILIYVVGIS